MITLLIIIVTVLFSLAAFNRQELMYKYNFNAYQIMHRKQWYRLFTHAFLHANWEHLIVNMIVLFSFGNALSYYLHWNIGKNELLIFSGIYLGGIVLSSIFSLAKEKDNYNYNAVGASGAVSAVVFSCILFEPLSTLEFMFFIPIKAVIFGVLYLAYSYYMGKKNIDNVGHDAHFWGAVYGFVFPILVKPSLLANFFEKLLPF